MRILKLWWWLLFLIQNEVPFEGLAVFQKTGKGEAFNFSNEIQMTVSDVVEKILMLMGSDLKPDIYNEASNEILHQYLSAEKARRRLGWAPLFNIEQGLEHTVNWYKMFFGAN